MPLVFTLVFALAGGIWAHWLGFVAGGLLGWLLGTVLQQRARLDAIARRLEELQAAAAAGAEPPAREMPAPPSAPVSATPRASSAQVPSARDPAPTPAASPSTPHDVATNAPRQPAAIASLCTAALERLKHFFVGGNPVVKIGVVVLFIGVAFLLRYAAERFTFPVELRLAAVAAGAIAALVIGWRLRHRADAYGLILQGAAVGVLYLTVFAAARLYELIPTAAAFALLVFIVLFSTMLAVLQNAQVLAVFALAGGFLAPVLMSTGTGSHVALFSYYALLNAGVLAMAWLRAWRAVNWVGFVFTFVIGATWGYQYYEPAHFSTTEPFLVLFFLYYVAVSVLFMRPAVQQRAGTAAVLDGTLVFGTPIVAFALQAGLVRELEFGLAYSALFVAVVYVALTAWLRRQHAFDSLLGQSYLALGIVFASLAIPFAFDNQRWTGAAWALEGAGLVWVGLRQQRLLPRLLGAALQLAAGLAFLSMASRAAEPRLVLNSVYLGCVMLSLAGLFSALQYHRHARHVHGFEKPLAPLLLGWGLLWWFTGGVREVAVNVAGRYAIEVLLTYVTASFAALMLAAIRLRWPAAGRPALISIPLTGLLVLIGMVDARLGNPFVEGGWLVWPLAMFLTWHGLHLAERHVLWAHRMLSLAHAAALTVLVALLCWTLYAGIDALTRGAMTGIWRDLAWGLVPAVLIVALPRLQQRGRWPFAAFPEAYRGLGLVPLCSALVVWLVAVGFAAADPAPLPYVPVVNPAELAQLSALLALYDWSQRQHTLRLGRFVSGLRIATAALAFVWLNTVAVRAVHFFSGVPYPLERIIESAAFQATISILWTLTALGAMVWGSRRSARGLWIAGAGLLTIVIAKLLTVDLSDIGPVARIVSFVSVGGLMLVIGFLAPLPPRHDATATASAEHA